ncbi:MAG: sterol desaturase family protein [bacterium]
MNALFDSQLIVPGTLAGAFLLLLCLEAVRPLRRRSRPLTHRLLVNFCMTGLVFVVGTFVVKPVGGGLSVWTSYHLFGLLHLFEVPSEVQFILGFLLMDLTFYYWHRANHLIPILWRFHNVHHVDPDLDVSTAFRFHVVEILYSTAFRFLQVGLIGISPITYAVYEITFACATMFHHCNFHIPIRYERLLNKVIVTPRMHGIHHSNVKNETNSNYSVVFRWWDALHKSLRLNIPQSQIKTGIAAYQKPEDNTLLNLLRMPFGRQREYWRLADGKQPLREVVVTEDPVGYMKD